MEEALPMTPQFLGRFQPDGFVLALVGTVAVATLLPCQGTSAGIFHTLGSFAMPAAHLQRCPRSNGTYGLGWSEGSAFSPGHARQQRYAAQRRA